MRLEQGWVSIGDLVPRSETSLAEEIFSADEQAMMDVGQALADLLLVPELCAQPPHHPGPGPDGSYPRWGRTYFAEPPLGGQNKRWLVVSHDHFNAGSGDAVCVRTTSNTSYTGPETPLIEGGTALAVCPDVQTKAHHRFDLASAARLRPPTFEERRKVARALGNYLRLHPFALDRE